MMGPIEALRYLRLWLKLKPILENEGKLMKMKLTTTTIIQIILGLIQILNLIQPLLSVKGKVYVAAAVGILQIVINTISHLSNPDGTNARVAWDPKENSNGG